jgi:hypothetical protein
LAHAVGGSALQVGIEFLAATADGVDMQAGDAGHDNVAAVADLLGLQTSDPAALLFIESVEKQIHLAVQRAFGAIIPRNTSGALTLMNGVVVHDGFSEKVLAAEKRWFTENVDSGYWK